MIDAYALTLAAFLLLEEVIRRDAGGDKNNEAVAERPNRREGNGIMLFHPVGCNNSAGWLWAAVEVG